MEPDLAANKSLDLGEKDPLVRDRRNKRRALSCPLAREDGEEAIAAAGWQRSDRPTADRSWECNSEGGKESRGSWTSEGGTESTDITAANVLRGESSYLELHARRLSSEPLPSSSSPPSPDSVARSVRTERSRRRKGERYFARKSGYVHPSFFLAKDRRWGGRGEWG